MKRLLFCLLLIPVGTLEAQEKKADLPPIAEIKLERKEPIDYALDIEPIFENKCKFCHSGSIIEGKFDMSTHSGVMKGGKRGQVIVPGKAAESILYQFSSRQKKPIMPPKSEEPLTPQELALIKLWIDQGAKNSASVREKPKLVVSMPPAIVKPVRAVAISADKKLIAGARGNRIFLFEPTKGEFQAELLDPQLVGADKKPAKAAHVSLVESLAFSPDGKTLASGSFQEVILWDTATGHLKTRLSGFAERVVALAWSPDGKLLATGGGMPTEDGEVKLFDASGKPVREIKAAHSDTVFGVCFSADNSKLATCGADKFIKTWEVASGKFLKAFEGHTHHVLDVGWTQDGKQLASAGADNGIKIWDFEKGEKVRDINGHKNQVTRLQFLASSSQFITCGGDSSAKLWNTNGGTIRSFSGSTDFLYAVAVSPDGKLVVTGGEEGIIRLYNGETAQLIKVLVPAGEEPPAKK